MLYGESSNTGGGGYILKTDPMKVLLDKEVQKQEYQRALREQIEINNQKKRIENQKLKEQDIRLEQDIRQYYEKLREESKLQKMPNAFSKYDEIPASPLQPKAKASPEASQNFNLQPEPANQGSPMLDMYE